MTERPLADSVDDRPEMAAPPHTHDSPVLKWGPTSLRFDDAESPAGAAIAGDAAAASVPAPVSGKLSVLAEASQLVLQVQQQLSDLDRREQQFAQRLTEFEHDERRFRLWANETEADLQERRAAILEQESALAQRLTVHDRELREYEERCDQFEIDRAELDRQRAGLQAEMQAELDRERQILADERHALNVQQAKVQELGDALLEQHRTQQERIAHQLQQERDQLWESLSSEWADQRAKFELEKAEFFKDRTLLENRIRFQQDHLEKTRLELEQDRQAELFEQQRKRQQLETGEQQLLLRKTQLDRYRAALEEMDRALERERDLHSRWKAAFSSTAEQERQHQESERLTWENERQQQQAELRRQQELLLAHSEQIETRKARLESLRREVEQTNHETMELRLAVEEVWSQVQQHSGATEARAQVEQARAAVTRDYEQLQARLWEQRQELLDAERNFEQHRQAFQEERRMLTEWIAARDQELQQKEQEQRRVAVEQQSQDQELQALQERWLTERSEAEQVIRRLLDDLIAQSASLPAPGASELAGR